MEMDFIDCLLFNRWTSRSSQLIIHPHHQPETRETQGERNRTPERKKEITKLRCEDNIKIGVTEIGFEDVNWIQLPQDRVQGIL
jgi:hypothetical protein